MNDNGELMKDFGGGASGASGGVFHSCFSRLFRSENSHYPKYQSHHIFHLR
jgi:hypothetical protein